MKRLAILLLVAACGPAAHSALPTARPTTPTAAPATSYCLAGKLPDTGHTAEYRVVRAGGVAECHGLFASAAAASATIDWMQAPLLVHALAPDEAAEAARTQPSFLGPPSSLLGNAETGPSRIERAVGRDAVAVFYQSTFEGEPGIGKLWVLDGVTDTALETPSWGFAFEPGGQRVIYSVEHLLEDDTTEQPTDHRQTVATRIGVPVADLARFSFQDGFTGNTWLCQPVRATLGQPGLEPLPLAGGCDFAADRAGLVALTEPHYFLSPPTQTPPAIVPYLVQLTPPHLVPVAEPERARTLALFERPTLQAPPDEEPPVGQRVAATENGHLAMIVVGPRWAVQVARLPR